MFGLQAIQSLSMLSLASESGGGAPDVHVLWILPFALLLGSIATMPLFFPKVWEHHYPKFSYVLGGIVAVYYLFIFKDPAAPGAWIHEVKEYVSFICLLGSLFVVSGGIVINVSRHATPMTNTVMLLLGAGAANLFGTTGAAMLLIRPYMRINKDHLKPFHIIFFIFMVANCGGCLTPIGDPPLFMGYLKGVPFFWVVTGVWPMWLMTVGLLAAVFYALDRIDHGKTPRPKPHDAGPAVSFLGMQNFLFIGVIIFAVFQPSIFEIIDDRLWTHLPLAREILMLAAAIVSKLTTRPEIHHRNSFSYGPIKEVAILFIGIFSTMVPALNYLNRHSEQMPLKTPGQYYFLSGILSAVLDNAPTYLVFLETKQGQIQNKFGPQVESLRKVMDDHPKGEAPKAPPGLDPHLQGAYDTLLHYNKSKVQQGQIADSDIRIAMMIANNDLLYYLIAISLGSVFFGACTYIGNGPNFMVKSIAESAGVSMPSFFGYIFRYTLPVLIPIYVLIWAIFLMNAPGI